MKDKVCRWFANMLPRRVAYFAYIRIHVAATAGKYSDRTPDSVTWNEALEAWEE